MNHLPNPDTQPEFYSSVATKRFVAWLFDIAFISLLCIVPVFLTFGAGLFFLPLIYAVISFAYRVITISNGSATLGMRFMGIELRDAFGERMDMGKAIAHTAGYFVSMAFFVVQIISVIMMLTSARGQGLTDSFLGTVMINQRA
ncbi:MULTISPECIES: RDD family protein [unclassified Ruegeria]|uniref:RDD family protein n=1 Tax=unclassified Ruegeria TaxID=2625375 RepID=UPI001488D8F0|nr:MULTISPECIES: RDD family protein [unclassified Ruegeria]NOD63035.1 RDD family protein [Ruegeria sp. HKCCD6109]NOD77270.1 RDD family protein [Ruegeria sp. HKCCD4332]NOD87693.1 RDD family protein [Ruegeria sp. HKCCD4318]NOD91789.1 RDD family protein [Ruegeria sp. HKCCD4884]NOE14063.1 RDD family protein [Ruegeria sp. HKCCD4318-2]